MKILSSVVALCLLTSGLAHAKIISLSEHLLPNTTGTTGTTGATGTQNAPTQNTVAQKPAGPSASQKPKASAAAVVQAAAQKPAQPKK